MAIKTILENLTDAPEGLHEFYKETDGKFILDVEGIDDHPDVSNLRNAYQRVKDSEKTIREENKALKLNADSLPEDFDVSLWEKAKSGELESGLVKIRERLEGENATLKGENDSLKLAVTGNTVTTALAGALDAANITEPAFRRAATALLKDTVKLEGDKVHVDTDMGPLDVKDYVKKWAGSDEGKAFVSQPKGGGSKPGNPDVTAAPKSWSEAKTPAEKAEYIKSNPK